MRREEGRKRSREWKKRRGSDWNGIGTEIKRLDSFGEEGPVSPHGQLILLVFRGRNSGLRSGSQAF